MMRADSSPQRRICTVHQLTACLSPEAYSRLDAIPRATELLADLLARAAEDWPEISVPGETIARYLADRLPSGESMQRALQNWHVSELFLCCACARGDTEGIAAFYEHFVPLIRAWIRRTNLRPPLSDDIELSLIDELLVGNAQSLPMITRYAGLGKLSSWLRVVVTRTARRMLERERNLVPVDDEQLARYVVSGGGVDVVQAKQHLRSAFKQAFKTALNALDGREATLLRQRYADGLSLQHMGAIYRVHHTTVHRWIEQIRDTLLRRTHELLMGQLRVDEDECASIIRLIQTNFDLTLHTFFGTPPAGPGTAGSEDDPDDC